MTFVREQHRLIAIALGCLDAQALREWRCYFAGGARSGHRDVRRPRGDQAQAYGQSVFEDAQSAVASLQDRDRAIERCREALGMTYPSAVVVDPLRRLSAALTRAWRVL